jgi:hypothetical protein
VLARYSVVFAENIGKIEKLPGIVGKVRKLGEDQTCDVPALDVFEHPLGLGRSLTDFPLTASRL